MQKFGLIPNMLVDGDELAPVTPGGPPPSAAALTSKTNYETGVVTMLTALLRTFTGWAVMTEVFGKQKKMIIRPYHATPQTGQFNATAGALDVQAATMQGTTTAGGQGYGSATKSSTVVTGTRFYQGYRIKIQGVSLGKPYTGSFRFRLDSPTQVTLLAYSTSSFGDDSFDVKWEGDTGPIKWIIEGGPTQPPVIGTGTGSDTEIRFSPDTFAAPGAPTGPGAKPDEILLHEMVHGLRQMAGRAVFEEVAGNPGMDNYEEFAAIVISNVYRSELGITQLRKDHTGFAPLSGPEATVATFKTTYQSYLLDMGVEQPQLCQNLRRVACVFNPFV
jgi:hypothetical protein